MEIILLKLYFPERTWENVHRPAHIPAHIPVKTWIPDNPGNPTLVTQLYFEGDPYRDEFVKKQLILEPINKNGTKFAIWLWFRRLPRNVSYYRKRK